MDASELYEILTCGEDSHQQFKANVTNALSLAQEIVAKSNTRGGRIFVGVSDQGKVVGLTEADIGRLNQLISTASSQSVIPPVNPTTEVVKTPDGLVLVIDIPEGISKPYADKNGVFWVQSGADKRKATSREEILRLAQSSGLVHGDELPASGLAVKDIDENYFREFVEREFGSWESLNLSLEQLLNNMNLASDDRLNIAGGLLFARSPQFKLPTFIVKAVAFQGNELTDSSYADSRDITGKLADVFEGSLAFVLRNLVRSQRDRSVNSSGELEIPRIVFEELIANALVHRDYLISAPVRILVFRNRIQIVSPGRLPNNLTVENIRLGNSNIRNPILASFAAKLLPYRGLGSGILRALRAWSQIDFVNDKEGEKFEVTIHRNAPSSEAV